jgi:hypothetical protein
MTKFFVPKPFENAPVAPWMAPYSEAILFKAHLPLSFFETKAQRVDAADQAEAIVLPNNFSSLSEDSRRYIAKWAEESEQYKIPLFLFSGGDYTDSLVFDPRAKVFKLSLYRSDLHPHDISMPTLIDDLGYTGITLRSKTGIPTVSFCGKAGFASYREKLGSWGWRMVYEITSIWNPSAQGRIRGIFWRMRVIKACRNSSLVKTYFVVRKTFSGAARTIEVPPEQARKEFIDSMLMSDFVLATKGDGNYSNRFIEALSMGRIPVFVDTDIVLPLENIIEYEKISVRIPMNRVSDTPRFIKDFYDGLNEGEWQARQRLARETFEKYLRQDSFFEHIFNKNVS